MSLTPVVQESKAVAEPVPNEQLTKRMHFRFVRTLSLTLHSADHVVYIVGDGRLLAKDPGVDTIARGMTCADFT